MNERKSAKVLKRDVKLHLHTSRYKYCAHGCVKRIVTGLTSHHIQQNASSRSRDTEKRHACAHDQMYPTPCFV